MIKFLTLLSLALICASSPSFSAPTAEFDTLLIAGNYQAPIFPSLDPATAEKAEARIKTVSGIDSVKVNPSGNFLQFTVKSRVQLDASQIDQALKKAAPWASLGEPEPSAPQIPLP